MARPLLGLLAVPLSLVAVALSAGSAAAAYHHEIHDAKGDAPKAADLTLASMDDGVNVRATIPVTAIPENGKLTMAFDDQNSDYSIVSIKKGSTIATDLYLKPDDGGAPQELACAVNARWNANKKAIQLAVPRGDDCLFEDPAMDDFSAPEPTRVVLVVGAAKDTMVKKF